MSEPPCTAVVLVPHTLPGVVIVAWPCTPLVVATAAVGSCTTASRSRTPES